MLPQKVWLLWLQGEKNAPPIVERCIEQWRQKNPTWQVIVLDRQNLHEFLDLKLPNHLFSKLTPQQQSDLIRLTLLMQQGGVWADATTFCITPLNEWLSSLINSGCFLFSRPGKDRLIANWFIAAYPNHYLIHSWHDFLAHYWLDNTFEPLNFWQQQLVNILYIFLTFNCYVTQYWFSDIITKFLKVYPYYSPHYAFFSLIHRDSRAKELWQSIPYLSANVPLKLVRRGLFRPLSSDLKKELEENPAPLYKLTWKHPKLSQYFSNPEKFTFSTLHYLLTFF